MKKDAAMLYPCGVRFVRSLGCDRRQSLARSRARWRISRVECAGVPATDRHLRGARVRASHPISGLAAGVGLNVTLISYAGSMDFGSSATGIAVRPRSSAVHTREAFIDLRRAADGATAPAPGRRQRPRVGKARDSAGQGFAGSSRTGRRSARQPIGQCTAGRHRYAHEPVPAIRRSASSFRSTPARRAATCCTSASRSWSAGPTPGSFFTAFAPHQCARPCRW